MDLRTPIARVAGLNSAAVQILFKQCITGWQAAGLRVAGLIEETHGLTDRTCNAGRLRNIVSGQLYSIYLDTPKAGTSCHIDSNGAEKAGSSVLGDISDCDLVVLSKFGKLEAAKGGLIGAFDAAIAIGAPLLTTVSEKHQTAWQKFAPQASVLAADQSEICVWLNNFRCRAAGMR